MNGTVYEIYRFLILHFMPLPEFIYGFVMTGVVYLALCLLLSPVLNSLENRHSAGEAVRLLHGSMVAAAVILVVWPAVFMTVSWKTGFGWTTGNIRFRVVIMALFLIWMGGFLIKTERLVRLFVARRRQRKAAHPVGAEANEVLAEVQMMLGIRRKAVLLQSEEIFVPEVRGVFRPLVLIPEDYENRVVPAVLRAVLTHELTHFRHGDILFRLLLCLEDTLLWFVFTYGWWNRQLRVWEERYCDECTCRTGVIGRRAYVDLLLEEQLRLNSCRKHVAGTTAFVSPSFRDDFEKRLDWLEEEKERKPFKKIFPVLMASVVALSCITASAAGVGLERVTQALGSAPVEGYDVQLEIEDVQIPVRAPDGYIYYSMDISEAIPTDMLEMPMAEDHGVFQMSLTSGSEWKTGFFNASSVQSIILIGYIDPSTVTVQVGIIGPTGLRSYVLTSGDFHVAIPVIDTGYQRVFIKNTSSGTVTIGGGYHTADNE